MASTPTVEHDLIAGLNNLRRKSLLPIKLIFDCQKAIVCTFNLCFLWMPLVSIADLNVVIIEGLGGETRYAEQFDEQINAIRNASATLTESDKIRLFRAEEASRDAILEHFESLAADLSVSDQVAVYMIGHGSYDDYQYKFNITGPDLTGEDLTEALNNLPSGNQLLVNTSSASGVMLEALQRDDRMLIFATRSGVERHATRFGNYFAAALTDATADIDKNRVVSAAEAFSFAERQVADYFERNGQLVTEHARMDGDRVDRFGLSRLDAKRTSSSDDPRLEELIGRREALSVDIDELRLARDEMAAGEYQERLLENMLELAQIEESIELREGELGLND